MRRIALALLATSLLGGIAAAADLRAPVRGPVYSPPPPVSYATWTGCYLGISGGGAWGKATSYGNGTNNGFPNGTPVGALKNETDLSGGLVGGTIGCNYQVGGFVFGIEADDSWTNKKGASNLLAPAFNPNFREEIDEKWLATLRGRLGYAFGPALLYATGGGAWAGVSIHEFSTLAPAVATATEEKTLSGWVLGGGLEWAFAPSWSAKAEYLHVDLGKNNTYFATTASGCCTSQNTQVRNDIFRVGINYRFGGGPVYANY